jgi:hypothetical protein
MVHLLSAVKLKPSVTAATFAETIRQLSATLEQQHLLSTTGPVDKRFPPPDHGYRPVGFGYLFCHVV